jgi:DNA (cytosine-5)-methyltransferase 1
MSKKLKVISLFSGAGGMDLGFKKAGFETVWANDNFAEAVETFKKNIGPEIYSDDIEKIDLESIPDADVIIGGFPCQGFSVANTKRTVDDERNILYRYFVKIVQHKRPKFFVAENVKGLLNIGEGKVINKIVNDFQSAGYQVRYHLFNTANYGVPQTRQRVIILGIRSDLDADIEFPPKPTHSASDVPGLKKYVSIAEALKDIPDPDSKHDLKNHVYTKYKQKFNGYISNRIVDPNKPSPTVTARGDDKGGAMIGNHPFAPRRLSCRELAAIQGFPLDFEFAGSMTAVYRQIGNAVPPPFAEVIAKTILNAVNKGLRTRTEEEQRTIVKNTKGEPVLFVA